MSLPNGYWNERLEEGQRLVGTMRRTARFTTATGRRGTVVDHGDGGTSVTFRGSTRTFFAQGREVTIKGTKELVTISSRSVVTGGWNGPEVAQ